MTIEYGVRCNFCKEDLFPDDNEYKTCSCGRTRIDPRGVVEARLAQRVSRIKPNRRNVPNVR